MSVIKNMNKIYFFLSFIYCPFFVVLFAIDISNEFISYVYNFSEFNFQYKRRKIYFIDKYIDQFRVPIEASKFELTEITLVSNTGFKISSYPIQFDGRPLDQPPTRQFCFLRVSLLGCFLPLMTNDISNKLNLTNCTRVPLAVWYSKRKMGLSLNLNNKK